MCSSQIRYGLFSYSVIYLSTEIEISDIGLCCGKALKYFILYIVSTSNKKLELKYLLLVCTENTEKNSSKKHIMPFYRHSNNENIAKAIRFANY